MVQRGGGQLSTARRRSDGERATGTIGVKELNGTNLRHVFQKWKTLMVYTVRNEAGFPLNANHTLIHRAQDGVLPNDCFKNREYEVSATKAVS